MFYLKGVYRVSAGQKQVDENYIQQGVDTTDRDQKPLGSEGCSLVALHLPGKHKVPSLILVGSWSLSLPVSWSTNVVTPALCVYRLALGLKF